MKSKPANIFSILLPAILLFALMTIALVNHPLIFDKSLRAVLLSYGTIVIYLVIWVLLKPDNLSRNAGVLIGLLFILNFTGKIFIDWPSQQSDSIFTLAMRYLIYGSFAVIAAMVTVRTGNIVKGIKSSLLSALLGLTIATTFSFLMAFFFGDRLIHTLKVQAEFKSYNPAEFTFFSLFYNSSNQLIVVPLISIVAGLAGSILGYLYLKVAKKR